MASCIRRDLDTLFASTKLVAIGVKVMYMVLRRVSRAFSIHHAISLRANGLEILFDHAYHCSSTTTM